MKDVKSKKPVKSTFCFEYAKKVGVRKLLDLSDDEYTEYCHQLRRTRITSPLYLMAAIPGIIAATVALGIGLSAFIEWTGVTGTLATFLDATLAIGMLGVTVGLVYNADRIFVESMYGKGVMEWWHERKWKEREAAYVVEEMAVEDITIDQIPEADYMTRAERAGEKANALHRQRKFSEAAHWRDENIRLSLLARKRDAEELQERKAKKQGKLL